MTKPMSGKMALTFAGIFLVLATAAAESLGAQRLTPAETAPSPEVGLPGPGQELQLAALRLDSGKLGEAASKAVRQWPAAQNVNADWDWPRVLVFLVQTALLAQGYDPGRPDGIMGPKTMFAFIAWSAVKGPPMSGKQDMAYIHGMDGNVTHLLRTTLENLGLSPGPEREFLGPESVRALDRFDNTFRLGAMFMKISESMGNDIVMDALGPAEGDPAGEASAQPARGAPSSGTHASPWGEGAIECISVEVERRSDGHRITEHNYYLKNNCGMVVNTSYCLRPPLPTYRSGGPKGVLVLDNGYLCGPAGYRQRQVYDSTKVPYCSKWVINKIGYSFRVGKRWVNPNDIPRHPIEGTIVDRCNYYDRLFGHGGIKPGKKSIKLFSTTPDSRKPSIIIAACMGQNAEDSEVTMIVGRDGKFRCLKSPFGAHYGFVAE